MTHLYANLREKYKRKISFRYDLLPVILESWLHSLNKTRNTCAHHSRLWNKNLGHLPKFPQIVQNQSIGQFSSEQAKLINNSVFINLSIMKYLLRFLAFNNNWADNLFSLLDQYKNISVSDMGFPDDWETYKIWQV